MPIGGHTVKTTSRVVGAAICAGSRAVLPALVSCLALSATAAGVAVAQGPPSEHEVKAVFLYNFAKFVGWPAEVFRDPSTPLTICVGGVDPFGDILDSTTRGEKIEGRAIALRRLSIDDDLRGCHILFVGSSERRRFAGLFETLKGASVLTVGETDDFARLGGIVQFTKDRYRIGIEINIEAAERAHLRISSRLLSLARITGSASASAGASR